MRVCPRYLEPAANGDAVEGPLNEEVGALVEAELPEVHGGSTAEEHGIAGARRRLRTPVGAVGRRGLLVAGTSVRVDSRQRLPPR
jgi:hypothetical protein